MLTAEYDYDMDIMVKQEEAREEGRSEATENGAKGIVQMGKEFRLSNDDILARLQENLKISLEEAKGYLDKFSK